MFKKANSTNLSPNELPTSLQAANIPKPFTAAEQGKFTFLPQPKSEVKISGTKNKMSIYEIEGSPITAAIVDLNSRYPEPGAIALNAYCSEKVTSLEGQVSVEINGKVTKLKKGCYVILAPGDSYSFSGTGKIIILNDSKEGSTHKLSEFPEPASESIREDSLTRAFLRYLLTTSANTAGAWHFLTMNLDPRTCPLEKVRGQHCRGLRIEKLQIGPGTYRYMEPHLEKEKTIYNLKEGEIALTYHWNNAEAMSGSGGSAHIKLKHIGNGRLESVKEDVFDFYRS